MCHDQRFCELPGVLALPVLADAPDVMLLPELPEFPDELEPAELPGVLEVVELPAPLVADPELPSGLEEPAVLGLSDVPEETEPPWLPLLLAAAAPRAAAASLPICVEPGREVLVDSKSGLWGSESIDM